MKIRSTDKSDRPATVTCPTAFAVKLVDYDRDMFSTDGFSYYTREFLEGNWDDIVALGLKAMGEVTAKQERLQQMQQNLSNAHNAYNAYNTLRQYGSNTNVLQVEQFNGYGQDRIPLQYPGKIELVLPEQQLTTTPPEGTAMANGNIITALTRNQITIKSLLKRGWTEREITQLFVARSPLGTELDIIEQTENDIEVVRMWQANAAPNATA